MSTEKSQLGTTPEQPLYAAEHNDAGDATSSNTLSGDGIGPETNSLPTLPEVQDAVQAALQDVQKADTLDTVRRRINGTSALVTRVTTMGGLPTLGTALLSGAPEIGPRFAAGGTATFLAGAVISTAMYIGQRRTEAKRLAKREESQQAVRDHLSEPVDLIRQKSRRNKETTLRWFGADEHYGGHTDPSVPNRFAKIVDFAEERKLEHIVVSKQLFGKNEALAADYLDKAIDTEQLTKKTKGVVLSDQKADQELLKLTTAEARQVVEKLEANGKILRVEALGDWLLACDPDHSISVAYKNWIKNDKSEELKPALIQAMRICVERRAQDEAYGNSRRMYIETDETRVAVKERLATTVTALPDGIRTMAQGIEPDSPESLTLGYQGFSETVGMDIETFVAATTKLSALNLTELRKAKNNHARQMIIGMGKLHLAKLELALFYALNKPDVLIDGLRSGTARPGESSADIPTLYSRITNERPRSTLGFGLRGRGKVPKHEQTITYDRLSLRNLGKKVGALALAGGIALGAGWGWSEGWSQSERWTMYCDPKIELETKDRQKCDDTYYPWFPLAEKPADMISEFNGKLETDTLIHLYQKGFLNDDSLKSLSKNIPEKWAREKREDIERRVNLYGGNRSQMGDVKHKGNPAVWSLESLNGANTVGFWASDIQDHITIQGEGGYPGARVLPPLTSGGVDLSKLQVRDSIVPIGTQAPDYPDSLIPVREMHIPETPPSDSSVVRVSGRQLHGDLNYLGTNKGANSKRIEAYSLPVIEGGDIVAARAAVKDLATDAIIANPDILVYQEENGTFRLGLKEGSKQQGYVDIEYWVDPNATTDLPVHAVHPMTSQKRGEVYRPLTSVVSEQQTAELRRRLNIPANATAEEVARAIRDSRDYSFAPYESSKKDGPHTINPLDEGSETGTMLVGVAEHAEEMDSANCNVSANIQIVTTRGKDGEKGFINGVTGFNNASDKHSNVLSQSESHQKMVNNRAQFIDATPTSGDITPPTPEEYRSTEAAESTPSSRPALLFAEAAALAGAAGYIQSLMLRTEIANVRRQRRLKRVMGWVAQTEEIDSSRLHSDLNMVNYILHSPSPLNEETLPTHITQQPSFGALQRLQLLPSISAEDFKLHVETRSSQGTLQLSPDTHVRLSRIVSAAQILNSMR